MNNNEISELISEIMTASQNGVIDWKNVPQLKKEIDRIANQRLDLLEKQVKIPSAEVTKSLIKQRVNAESDNLFNQFNQDYEIKMKAKLDQVDNQLKTLKNQKRIIENNLLDLQNSRKFNNAIIIISLVVAVIATASMFIIFYHLIGQGLGIKAIWNFASPANGFWGNIRGLGAILAILLMFYLAIKCIFEPSKLTIKLLGFINEKSAYNKDVEESVANTINDLKEKQKMTNLMKLSNNKNHLN